MKSELLDNFAKERKKKSFIYYVDDCFQLFIDNKINIDDLKSLLSSCGKKVLPNSFYELSTFEQKKYFSHHITNIFVDKNFEYEITNVKYNLNYFFLLTELARKSKQSTQKLVEYIKGFSFMKVLELRKGEKIYKLIGYNVNLNLTYFSFNFIRIDKFWAFRKKSRKNYQLALEKDFLNYYDFITYIFSFGKKPLNNNNSLCNKQEFLDFKQIQKELLGFMSDKEVFNLDFSISPEPYFFLLMETYISFLPFKLENTLKIQNEILSAKDIKNEMHFADKKNGIDILNMLKKEIQKNDLSELRMTISTYIKNNPSLVSSENVNGYYNLYKLLIDW